MSEVPAEWLVWGQIILNPGQSQTWWFTSFLFDEARFVHFDACPDQAMGNEGDLFAVQITEQWAERRPGGGVAYLVTFRNRGNTALVFRPRIAVVPAGRFWGGLSS